ncbi:MAG: metallophosphoesterase family protein [Planctomycetes bacterium]|nr:metallophosphoesterase family protein [Planctomycetota bacterium]
MSIFDRRQFLGTSLGGLAGLAAAGLPAWSIARETATAQGKLDSLFLTWQRDPTTTMTVQWLAPASTAADATVRCTLAKGEGSAHTAGAAHKPYPMTDLQVFRAELTGLKPGTEYQFTVGKGETSYRFRTMPAKATDAFQFISGGDCDVNEHAVTNNLLAARQDPMFTIIGGDLGYDDGKKVDKSLGFIRNYSQQMVDSQNRLIPLIVCLGNHEVDGGYGKPREKAPFYFALHDGLYKDQSYATLDFGDYLSLVLLDSGHISPIDGEQTAWLQKALAARADVPHLFAVNHVPSYPSYRSPDTSSSKDGTGELSRKHWVPLFEKHNVGAVFEHHDHTFKRTHALRGGTPSSNGVVYLGDGSWGKLRAPKEPESRPYLAKTDAAFHLSIHRLEGEQCFHLAQEEGGRIVDACVTAKRALRTKTRS